MQVKGENYVKFFCIIGFCILVASAGLQSIVLCTGAKVAFYTCYKYIRMTCTA